MMQSAVFKDLEQESQRLMELGIQLSHDKPIKIDEKDLEGTEFEDVDVERSRIHRDALAAEFYRKAILLNPNNNKAIFNLASCISKGVNIKASDLNFTRFEGKDLFEVDRRELEAELYRRSIRVQPYGPAYYYLAKCIEDNVAIQNIEIRDTKFSVTLGVPINRNELAAELYRKAIILMPTWGKPIRQLALCIKKGACIDRSDLVGTKFEMCALDSVDRDELVTELFIRAMWIDPQERAFLLGVASEIPQESKKQKTGYHR